jgi:hypothetical protein
MCVASLSGADGGPAVDPGVAQLPKITPSTAAIGKQREVERDMGWPDAILHK